LLLPVLSEAMNASNNSLPAFVENADVTAVLLPVDRSPKAVESTATAPCIDAVANKTKTIPSTRDINNSPRLNLVPIPGSIESKPAATRLTGKDKNLADRSKTNLIWTVNHGRDLLSEDR
jgi:hypothetical protein